MKAPSPEVMLDSMTSYDLKRWRAWMKIRGPIGGIRSDNYVTYMALHSRRAIGGKEGRLEPEHFLLPWMEPENPGPAANDPYDTYDPKRDGEVYL